MIRNESPDIGLHWSTITSLRNTTATVGVVCGPAFFQPAIEMNVHLSREAFLVDNFSTHYMDVNADSGNSDRIGILFRFPVVWQRPFEGLGDVSHCDQLNKGGQECEQRRGTTEALPGALSALPARCI